MVKTKTYLWYEVSLFCYHGRTCRNDPHQRTRYRKKEKNDADNDAKLQKYSEKWNPAYRIAGTEPAVRAAVRNFFAISQGAENPVLPSSAIVDAQGNVRESIRGIPTLSQVRKGHAANRP